MKFKKLIEKYIKLLKQFYELNKSCPTLIIETSLQRIFYHFTNNEFGIVSAFKSEYTWEENLERNYQLSKDIRKLGYGFIPIIGRWEKIPEYSFFIPKITKDEIIELAKKYDQNYCIWGELNKWYLINAKTGEIEYTGQKFRVLKIDEEFDNYSALKFIIEKKPDIEILPPEEKEKLSKILTKYGEKFWKFEPIKKWRFEQLIKKYNEHKLSQLKDGDKLQFLKKLPIESLKSKLID